MNLCESPRTKCTVSSKFESVWLHVIILAVSTMSMSSVCNIAVSAWLMVTVPPIVMPCALSKCKPPNANYSCAISWGVPILEHKLAFGPIGILFIFLFCPQYNNILTTRLYNFEEKSIGNCKSTCISMQWEPTKFD